MPQNRQPIIFLDPGHGGHETVGRSTPHGARGPSGTLEKDVALALARSVARHVGGGVHLTRDADVNLSLGARIDRARRAGADVFVSLHADAGAPTRSARAFTHTAGSQRSRALATAIERQLVTFGGPGTCLEHGELAVLDPSRHAPHTAACLLEVDDLASAAGESRLRDPHALDRIGRAIADGIRRYGGAQALGGPSGLPNLYFGPPGPGGRPLGAVVFSNTPTQGNPVAIQWTVYNESVDTEAGSGYDRVTVKDASGRTVLDDLRRRDVWLRPGQGQPDQVMFTPASIGPHTARVVLNAGEMPIPESTLDDNTSEITAMVEAPTRGEQLASGTARGLAEESYTPALGPLDQYYARIEALVAEELDGGRIIQTIQEVAAGIELPSAPAEVAGYGDPQSPPPVRPGTFKDLVDAILAYDPVRALLYSLQTRAMTQLRTGWNTMTPGERPLFVLGSAMIGAGMTYAVLRSPQLQGPAQSLMQGALNAGIHTRIPELDVRFNILGNNPSVQVSYDFAPLLRRAGAPF